MLFFFSEAAEKAAAEKAAREVLRHESQSQYDVQMIPAIVM